MKAFDLEALEPGGRLLLLAPHCDDEVLGAGGTARLLAARGLSVQPVIAARSPGVRGGAGPETRVAEARAACELLGVEPPLFLDLPSAELRAAPRDAGAGLAALLADAAPLAGVLAPWPFERHDTHRATLLAGLWALHDAAPGGARATDGGAALFAPDAPWWGYGVWDALPAGPGVREVDITAARAAKTRAAAAHKSQMEGRAFGAAMACRDLAQAVFSRVTGEEPRRAVERLVDLGELARVVSGGESPAEAVAAWSAGWARSWAQHLWPDV